MKLKELFVNTQGACFLCLKEMSGSETTSSEMTGIKTNELCLRNICRYLKINPRKVLLKSLQENVELNDQEDDGISLPFEYFPCDFSVTLCAKCGMLAGKLSSLIRELEVAQMMVEYHIQSLDKVLSDSMSLSERMEVRRLERRKDADDDDNNQEYANDTVKNSSEDETEVRLMKVLREETKAQCSRKLKTISKSVVPRIHLSKLRMDTVNKYKKVEILEDKIPNEISTTGSSDTIYYEYEDESDNCMIAAEEEPQPKKPKTLHVIRLNPPIIEESPTITLTPNNRRNPKTVTRKVSRKETCCPYCDKLFLRPGGLEEHMALCHPEFFFSQATKLPHLTLEDFQTCCVNLLEREMEACETTAKVQNIPIAHCSYCSASFRQLQDLQVHLCSRHVEQFIHRLDQVQRQLYPVLEDAFVVSNVKMETMYNMLQTH